MVDIEFYKQTYFPFDDPIKVTLKCGQPLTIKPVPLRRSNDYFASTYWFNKVCKRDFPQFDEMDELEFWIEQVLGDKRDRIYSFLSFFALCTDISNPAYGKFEDKYVIYDKDNADRYFFSDEFIDIKRVILYQNDASYDDTTYLPPRVRKNKEMYNKKKSKGVIVPNIERKMAIITAHSGILKKDLAEMTLRSFEALFQEVIGEAEFISTYAFSMQYAKNDSARPEHWIWKKEKTIMDGIAVSMDGFLQKSGFEDSSAELNRAASEASKTAVDPRLLAVEDDKPTL